MHTEWSYQISVMIAASKYHDLIHLELKDFFPFQDTIHVTMTLIICTRSSISMQYEPVQQFFVY